MKLIIIYTIDGDSAWVNPHQISEIIDNGEPLLIMSNLNMYRLDKESVKSLTKFLNSEGK